MVTPRTPRADARANRTGILDAARSALARDPFASVDAIARSAGLSRRTLYGHFDDRDALVRELIITGAQRFNALAESVDDDDPQIALARLAALLWHEAAHVQVTAALALDEAHLPQTAEALAPLRRVVADIVRRGQSTGSQSSSSQNSGGLRTDVAADVLSRLIEEVARTVVARDVIGPDTSSPAAADLAVRTVLSIAGLSWREADALLRAHPDVLSVATDSE
ncbi:TetR/AcrR family transcriptional regulator [Microbacterium sp. H1-D42]|uniref:TetR/AcrR family transcriptional regulator n=1 Tax=Microbacterium sp. H1-D42 TaxID=2925844 RepID=UPI001F530D66|nr:TetR/AcrR family transcriptional regulator [Microbacterium sp. H1-D42]UNK70820.1 TetR/AcrR family transcriptional regulator [Microbacterium sp. H1-D42]